ncbi:hypothetical protein BDZ94DRAFT_1287967 [Collybia nuda]|uniref:Glycosyl transferase family 25 domain-containing protein n=1 Tax=Collybia nuda TaxID=64659 RepID=A0A9P5YE03_9AGAR|nr:hypothetical protein BDZ94DRAFT_1287967 [Collybia nuda]
MMLTSSFPFRSLMYISLAPWSGVGTHSNRNETLGVASKIYVISLSSRADRRKQMELLRESLGLRWTYVEGIDAKNDMIDKILNSVRSVRATNSSGSSFMWPEDFSQLDERIDIWSPGFLTSHGLTNSSEPMLCATQDNTVTPYDPMIEIPEYRLLTRARIACWHSHLLVIQSIANDPDLNDTDSVIVLEDDLDMERDVQARLGYLWPFLPADWDMVYLGHCWSNETFFPALNAEDSQNALGTYIHPSKSPSCTHSYLLSKAGARRLLLHLRYSPFAYSRAVDRAFSWLIQSSRIRSFSVVPSVAIQRKIATSDVMSGIGSRWKDDLVNGVFNSTKV